MFNQLILDGNISILKEAYTIVRDRDPWRNSEKLNTSRLTSYNWGYISGVSEIKNEIDLTLLCASFRVNEI